MKEYYAIEIEGRLPAVADLTRDMFYDPNVWYINRINVPYPCRGTGIGSKLLQEILDDADTEHCVLVLDPLATGGLDHDQLIAWYKRHGFVESPYETGRLYRTPVGEK